MTSRQFSTLRRATFERQLQDPQFAKQAAEMATAYGVSFQQATQFMSNALDARACERERIWMSQENGLAYRVQQLDCSGRVSGEVEFRNVKVNLGLEPKVFFPRTAGMRIVETSLPYGAEIIRLIVEARQTGRVGPQLRDPRAARRAEKLSSTIIQAANQVWATRNLTACSHFVHSQANATPNSPPALMVKAVYLGLIEGKREPLEKLLEEIEALFELNVPAAYKRFKHELWATIDSLTNTSTEADRAKAVFEKFPDGFPFHELIREVGAEFATTQ
jgi:hypothetical protein